MGEIDKSGVFTEYCAEFLKSAEQIETMFAFSAIAVTAWNNADRNENELKEAVSVLRKRLKKDSIENKGIKHSVDDLIEKMVQRKRDVYADNSFVVSKASFEDDPAGLKVNVE